MADASTAAKAVAGDVLAVEKQYILVALNIILGLQWTIKESVAFLVPGNPVREIVRLHCLNVGFQLVHFIDGALPVELQETSLTTSTTVVSWAISAGKGVASKATSVARSLQKSVNKLSHISKKMGASPAKGIRQLLSRVTQRREHEANTDLDELVDMEELQREMHMDDLKESERIKTEAGVKYQQQKTDRNNRCQLTLEIMTFFFPEYENMKADLQHIVHVFEGDDTGNLTTLREQLELVEHLMLFQKEILSGEHEIGLIQADGAEEHSVHVLQLYFLKMLLQSLLSPVDMELKTYYSKLNCTL